jgi:uroporphyrinogen-III decarboxylase
MRGNTPAESKKGIAMFLNVGFSYQWWNKFYNLDFDEGFYFDIDRKQSTQTIMKETACSRFPWYERLISGVNDNVVSSPNIDVEPYGHRFIPAMLGCQVSYAPTHTPWAENHILSPEEIAAMPLITMDEFRADERVRVITDQVKRVREKYGWCSGQQNLGSVINTAIYLRGMDLFTDFYERPETIRKLYDLITNRMTLCYEYFAGLDGKYTNVGIGNCSVCMISPDIYEQFNRPFDLRIMELAKSHGVLFSLHQDSNVTRYIEKYKPFNYLYSFDIGCDTDVALFRKGFPETVLNIFVYTSFLLNRTPDEIRRDIRKMIADAADPAKTGFSCYDIDDNIPDEKVTALYDAVCGDKD